MGRAFALSSPGVGSADVPPFFLLTISFLGSKYSRFAVFVVVSGTNAKLLSNSSEPVICGGPSRSSSPACRKVVWPSSMRKVAGKPHGGEATLVAECCEEAEDGVLVSMSMRSDDGLKGVALRCEVCDLFGVCTSTATGAASATPSPKVTLARFGALCSTGSLADCSRSCLMPAIGSAGARRLPPTPPLP